jgi:glycosyltransferase involved in cell wall biosynthesis
MISVVIPAFNAGQFIRRTVDSILAQTYSDFEIIVVDDGSTDNTADVVRSYGPKVRYIYQQNAGDGPARNTGITAAEGDWIAFLDHDDEWLPKKLQLHQKSSG